MEKHKNKFMVIVLSMVFIFLPSLSYGQKKTESFEFEFSGNTLRGLIESSIDRTPTTLVILVPGSGKTDFVAGNWFMDHRDFFISQGMACCFWDKAGCGRSEGEFNNMEHPIEKSADEVIAAIKKHACLVFMIITLLIPEFYSQKPSVKFGIELPQLTGRGTRSRHM